MWAGFPARALMNGDDAMLIRLLTGDFANAVFLPDLSRNVDVFRLENGRYLVRGKLQIDGLTYPVLRCILSAIIYCEQSK